MNKNKFTYIDLFAGIGGFRLALDSLGGKCINFSEINEDAIATYCTNFNEDKDYNLGDITKIKSLQTHDLLTGGVPCQSWSIAGKNLGFDDDRGQLWNDTIYLLNQSKPKAFIFENVKGLADPRNKEALFYILERIKDAGYFAKHYLINSYDYGVPQNRIRLYIIGFKEKEYYNKFQISNPICKKIQLDYVLSNYKDNNDYYSSFKENVFEKVNKQKSMSLSSKNGVNDYFLFNDLRNGHSTIHSWDILNTTKRQKEICLLLLKNRRKKIYGNLDGNPLSFMNFKNLDNSIEINDLEELVNLKILKKIEFSFQIINNSENDLSDEENQLLKYGNNNTINIENLKLNRELKLKKISIYKTLNSLIEKNIIICNEIKYDFKNTKISTGLFGVNRIFLSTSKIFPTLVASDTNDFITTSKITSKNELEYKNIFLNEVYKKGEFRKITKEEACRIQGFPHNYILPENRSRWMKLLGNSVSVPVIEMIAKAISDTGVFENNIKDMFINKIKKEDFIFQ